MEEKPLLKDRITEQLREQVRSLQANVPVRIPSERELAERLGVSRISIRAALKSLASEGWLYQEQGRGTFIAPKPAELRELHILCSPDIKQNDPFYNEFLVRLTTEAAKRSIHLFIVLPDRLPAERRACPVVAVGQLKPELAERLADAYDRVALLLGEPSDRANALLLTFDDERIGREAADRLFDRGHRGFVLLAGPDRYRSAYLRMAGFTERVRERGGEATVLRAKMNWQGGYEAGADVAELLLESDNRPTALFAANDWMAAGLIQRLKERGLQVPEELSVVGCDDIPLSSQFEPGITTFRLDMKRMIEELLKSLHEAPDSGSSGAVVRLPAEWIERESCRTIFDSSID